ncbi:LysR family transcriptional regulator [Niveispirillum sp.]|uniref:LysR family transcriptional regulator n=1 Tax=Niveispirillum sp. TaxID=1917217 RepID=UPI001B6304D7|nr:LysR family transcriptional regulator [Niveispirillum sp.]MBP7337258.1 LysR family transcriptional regulator [Niveispirillum sp.]
MFDPRLLRAFVTIADTGSFTSAADRLHMTQSTISQQLGRLEQSVGQGLIDRAARPVRPTPAGERLLGPARRILSLQRDAAAMLSDPVGTSVLRIGLPEDIATVPVMSAFARFSTSHREIRLDVTTGLSRDIARRYRAGDFDIAIVKEAAAQPDHRASFAEPMAWFQAADGLNDWPDPIPLVAFPPGALYRDAMFERIEGLGRRWYIAFTGSSLDSVATAVTTGMGLSLLPVAAMAGRAVRPYHGLGTAPAMEVSLYAWESSGPIAELGTMMTAVLAARNAMAPWGGQAAAAT